MLSCKEVVKIVSSNDKASWRRRIEVRMHLFICHHCSKYTKQLEYLKIGIKNLLQTKSKSEKSEEVIKIETEVLRKLK